MDTIHAAQLQQQLKHNANEAQEFVKELGEWEDEIRQKDESLKKHKPILKQKLPPVRGQGGKESGGAFSREKSTKSTVAKKADKPSKPARIASYDYKQWDKLDVDKVCDEMDYTPQNDSSHDEELDEEAEDKARKRQAEAEKEKGNTYFKEGRYELAIECYTHGMDLDPLCHVLPANRAMALIKLERYAAAENDCCTSLALNDKYAKAYLRRGVARKCLGNGEEAGEDFRAVLKLEPANKQAKAELNEIENKKQAELPKQPVDEAAAHAVPSPYIQCVKRPPHLRSKVPLRRIPVEDIGLPSLVPPPSSGHTSPLISEVTSHPTEPATKLEGSRDPPTELAAKDVVTIATTGLAGEPGVPSSALQFQMDWKALRRSETSLVKYFKAIPPSKYPALLQQSLETVVFSDILRLLWQHYSSCDRSCLEELRWLTKVTRFQVAVMFLSKKDKDLLRKIFEDLARQGGDQSQLRALAGEYNVEVQG